MATILDTQRSGHLAPLREMAIHVYLIDSVAIAQEALLLGVVLANDQPDLSQEIAVQELIPSGH
jgi:hypothetical protein